jgi:hypothetical protein
MSKTVLSESASEILELAIDCMNQGLPGPKPTVDEVVECLLAPSINTAIQVLISFNRSGTVVE